MTKALKIFLFIFSLNCAAACHHALHPSDGSQLDNTLQEDTTGLWKNITKELYPGETNIIPGKSRMLHLELDRMMKLLDSAGPKNENASSAVEINIPLPTGDFQIFKLKAETALQKERPGIPAVKMYEGHAKSDSAVFIQVEVSVSGLHSMVQLKKGVVRIDPVKRNQTGIYLSYFKRDFIPGRQEQMPVDSVK